MSEITTGRIDAAIAKLKDDRKLVLHGSYGAFTILLRIREGKLQVAKVLTSQLRTDQSGQQVDETLVKKHNDYSDVAGWTAADVMSVLNPRSDKPDNRTLMATLIL